MELERAIELDPNYAKAIAWLASTHVYDVMFNLSPNDPVSWHCMGSLAHAHYNLELYEDAIRLADQAIAIRQGYVFGRIVRTAALGQLRRPDEARQSLDDIIGRMPGFSASTFDYYPFEIESQRDHLVAGLERAGMGTSAL